MKRVPLQIVYSDATDFPNSGAGPPVTAANSLIIDTAIIAQIDLVGLAATDGSRQSDKAFLPEIHSRRWSLDACLEFEAAPADGDLVFFYWAQSPAVGSTIGNAGGVTGSDAAFTETVGNLGQMKLIGTLSCVNATINIGHIGILVPTTSYGILIVNNQASQALRSTDGGGAAMEETHTVLTEIVE